MIDTIMLIWCDSCFRWHRPGKQRSTPPWWVRVRRYIAAPVRKLMIQPASSIITSCSSALDRFCYEGEIPAFDPPPGFVERGSDWAEYPKSSSLAAEAPQADARKSEK